MNSIGAGSAEPLSDSHVLFGRRALLIFTLVVLLITSLVVWAVGGIRDGQGVIVGLITLCLCLAVGGFVRWRLRIGLRSFFVLVTVLAVLCSLVAKVALHGRKVNAAVSSLKQEGAVVYFGISDEGNWFRTKSGFLLPQWTRTVLGDATFADVWGVDFQRSPVAAAQLQRIATNFPAVERLSLYQCQLAPGSMASAADIESLENLELSFSKVDDNEMASIGTMRRLKLLSLRGSQLTLEGTGHLQRLTTLDSLWIDGAAASDAGIRAPGAKPNLRFLSAPNGTVTNRGVEVLAASAPRLEILDLRGSPTINSDGVKALVKMTRLSHLVLQGARIDDRAFSSFAELTKLRDLDLTNSDVTLKGVEAFQRMRPTVVVRHNAPAVP